MGDRWHRFGEWFRRGSRDAGIVTCPACGEPFRIEPTPTYNSRFGSLTIPRSAGEIRAACPRCAAGR
jgi:hypothetical protein